MAFKISVDSSSEQSEQGEEIEIFESEEPLLENASKTVHYIDIRRNYSENLNRNHKEVSFEKHIQYLKNSTSSNVYSRYEILPPSIPVRLYFDIENIPSEQPELIKDIISALKTFLLKTLPSGTFPELSTHCIPHALTINECSSNHEGLSYHLYFPTLATPTSNQELLLKHFLSSELGKDYQDYLDTVVYSPQRLFRCAEQIGVKRRGNKNPSDIHHLVDGDISDTVIQYCPASTTNLINYEFPAITFNASNRKKKMSWNPKDKVIKIISDIFTETLTPAILNKQSSLQLSHKTIYDRIIHLQKLDSEKKVIITPNTKHRLDKMAAYYISHNNSFDNYQLSIEQIKSIVDLIYWKFNVTE